MNQPSAFNLCVAIGALLALVIVKKTVSSIKKRKIIRAKIAKFHREEQQRRSEIEQREDVDYSNIMSLTFRQLADQLQNGTLSAVDVLHAYQQAALRSTKKTNSVTEFILEQAEKAAADLDKVPISERKSLHGIPISVKEILFLPGTEATCGFSNLLGEFVNAEESDVTAFVQWLGGIPFVKTNVPQSLMSFDSRNPAYGLTRNPHDLSRAPGGSSNGEGALLGSKASIIGIGSDIGGSLRVPSAWSGCCTIKPCSARMLTGKTFTLHKYPRSLLRDFQSFGFMTQDLDTLVTIHRLLYSEETFQKFPMNRMAPIPFRENLFHSAQSRPLTIGYCDSDGNVESVPAIKRSIKLAKEALEKRGHRLVEWKPKDLLRRGILLYFYAFAVDGAEDIIRLLNDDIEVSFPNKVSFAWINAPRFAKSLFGWIGSYLWGEFPAQIIRNLQTGTTPQDNNVRFKMIKDFREEFSREFSAAGFDVLLWPSFPTPAVLVDAARDIIPAGSYSGLFNLLDWPAGISLVGKVVQSDEEAMASYPTPDIFHKAIKESNLKGTAGLPLSVQIVAPPYQEEMVFSVMKEIENCGLGM